MSVSDCLQMKKRKSKAAAGAPDRDASPPEEEETLPVDVTFSGPSRSNKHKRPVKKSRKMIEAEEAQVLHLSLLVHGWYVNFIVHADKGA